MTHLGNQLLHWFIRFGNRVFSYDSGHYVLFQPLLYLAMFTASVNIAIADGSSIPFGSAAGPYAPSLWVALGIWCPIMAGISWWLIWHCTWSRAALAGLWIRLGADLGQFVVLLVFLCVSVNVTTNDELHLYIHYITGAVMIYVLHLIARDAWSIVATERLYERMQTL